MFCDAVVMFVAAAAVASARVIKEEILHCSSDELPCGDGRCVGLASICDGVRDCSDGLDEGVCEPGFNTSLLYGDLVRRSKRQSNCGRTQWTCRDGTCIRFDQKCDGVVDCLDGSDETHPLCRHSSCQENLFRCTYGACADGDAACNGVQDCADNSDELLPRCRDEKKVVRGQFMCDSGDQIRVTGLCDGVTDCADGSDETIRTCAGKTCDSYLFQCAYGACVDNGSDCDGKIDCADGSDESDELCNRTSSILPTRPSSTTQRPSQSFVGKCKMPEFPQNGRYVVVGGDKRTSVGILVTCDSGFEIVGNPNLYCVDGFGFENMPRCLRLCTVMPHVSVEYTCEIRMGNSITTRPCQEKELPGTIVRATCQPNYRFLGVPNRMECKDGFWTHVIKCSPGLAHINITILIRDKVEVYVSRLLHTPDSDRPTTPRATTPVPHALDETFWRFADTSDERDPIANDISGKDDDVRNVINIEQQTGDVSINTGDTIIYIKK